MRNVFKASVLLLLIACGVAQCCQAEVYDEAYRPQFHFTYKVGWLSDVNGPFFYDGVYHLFTQHCPGGPGLDYGRIGWGHAVSKDLIHWEERPPAIAPDQSFGPAGSGGGGLVDWHNTSGLQTGDEPPLMLFYTGCRYLHRAEDDAVQCLAFSNDKGATWIKYEGNPILGPQTHYTRDPKVFWHDDSKQWIMAITLSCGTWQEGDHRFALFASANLKDWKKIDQFDMKTGLDCPDMFELPVDGDADNKLWVFWAGDGTHMFGKFDGKIFERVGNIQKLLIDWLHNGANGYGAMTFGNMPDSDGRCIQVAWLRHGEYPGMQFNQQTTFPSELTLHNTPAGVKLHRTPIKEIALLHDKKWSWTDVVLDSSDSLLSEVNGDAFDFLADIKASDDVKSVSIKIRGEELRYNPSQKRLHFKGQSVPAGNADRSLQLQILVDRTSVEIFADNGRTSMTFAILPNAGAPPWELFLDEGELTINSLSVWKLKSIWKSSE